MTKSPSAVNEHVSSFETIQNVGTKRSFTSTVTPERNEEGGIIKRPKRNLLCTFDDMPVENDVIIQRNDEKKTDGSKPNVNESRKKNEYRPDI